MGWGAHPLQKLQCLGYSVTLALDLSCRLKVRGPHKTPVNSPVGSPAFGEVARDPMTCFLVSTEG